MTRSPYELKIPAARRIECLELLAAWDAHNRWDDVAVQRLANQLYALITELTKPRILDVRGGEEAAKLLRGALGASDEEGE